MSMQTEVFNFWYLIVQILMWAAMLGTIWYLNRQFDAMKNGATGQNILSLVNFLQQEHVRDARSVVRRTLKDIPYKDWKEKDEYRHAADTVCATYDVAGILIFEQALVPAKPFVNNWGPSIRDCYEILLPHIREMQKPEHSGAEYWDDFGKLYRAVMKRSEG